MEKYSKNSINIEAKEIKIGERVTFGSNVDIKINGVFHIGDNSHLGSNCKIRGNNITIGCDLYNSGGLNVGGGGHGTPFANLTIGDRNTNHNDYINLARGVTFGDDVGLSPEVSIITHGAWLSILEGFPCQYAPVEIKSRTIIGYRSTIMPGITIGENSVIGACSLIVKSLPGNEVYGGVPAKKISEITPPNIDTKKKIFDDIIMEYCQIADSFGYTIRISDDYPIVKLEGCFFNVETLEMGGEETDLTDTFRGHLRRYGIRFYTDRPFKNFGEVLVKQ
jgi:acetyltransferase-like isoleucine patch superfamily enzyme